MSTEFPIVNIWTKSDEEKKTSKILLAGKRFKANSDTYMVEAESEKIEAEAEYQKALDSQLSKPDFAALMKARLRKRAADKTYSEALDAYENCLGFAYGSAR